jgi:hypothetical protein
VIRDLGGLFYVSYRVPSHFVVSCHKGHWGFRMFTWSKVYVCTCMYFWIETLMEEMYNSQITRKNRKRRNLFHCFYELSIYCFTSHSRSVHS